MSGVERARRAVAGYDQVNVGTDEGVARYRSGISLRPGGAGRSVAVLDPQGRFEFRYPTTFGNPLPGTNNGFGDRVAAIRFSLLPPSPLRLGGEAALTRGFPLVDLQAAGGFYDAITLEIFPDPLGGRSFGPSHRSQRLLFAAKPFALSISIPQTPHLRR